MLHGWPQTWYEWHHVMPALAKNCNVIVLIYDDQVTLQNHLRAMTVRLQQRIYISQYLNWDSGNLFGGHDEGSQTAYLYAAAHPNNASKLVIMNFTFPGYMHPPSGSTGRWWVSFHQTPDMPEALVQGKEKEYLSWFYKGLAYSPSSITQADTDEFVSRYSAPGGMRAGFEYYRAFPQDAKDNTELAATVKLTMPVLVLSDGVYPALGGDLPGSSSLNSTIPISGYKCAWYHSSAFRTLDSIGAATVRYKTVRQFLWQYY